MNDHEMGAHKSSLSAGVGAENCSQSCIQSGTPKASPGGCSVRAYPENAPIPYLIRYPPISLLKIQATTSPISNSVGR